MPTKGTRIGDKDMASSFKRPKPAPAPILPGAYHPSVGGFRLEEAPMHAELRKRVEAFGNAKEPVPWLERLRTPAAILAYLCFGVSLAIGIMCAAAALLQKWPV